MHIKSVLIGSALMVLSLAMFEPAGIAQGATTTQPPTTYYLALGDSLSTGVGATSGQGYVDDVYATEKSIIPGLQLVNLGCAGDSSQNDPRWPLSQTRQGTNWGMQKHFWLPQGNGEVRDYRYRRR